MELTFKTYLEEVDVSDLQLVRQHQDERQKALDYNKDANEYKNQMQSDRVKQAGTSSSDEEPVKGDIIVHNNKKYMINGRNNVGFSITELGGNKKSMMLKHGYKYVEIEKTPLGKRVFKLSK